MSRLAAPVSLAVLILALAAPASGKDSHYRLTDIGDLTSSGTASVTFAAGINDKGHIVGQSFDDQSRARAYLWRDGSMTDLGDIGLPGSRPAALSAFAVNKHDAVVGTAIAIGSNDTRAFRWTLGLMVNLDLLYLGASSFATSINDRGAVVGAGFRSTGDLRALRWVLGIPIEIGALDDGRVAVQAFGINDRGDIAGYLSPGGAVSFIHAFLWSNGKLTDLGTLPGTNLSFANALNDRGQVVGQSVDTNTPGTGRAVLWDGGTLQDLGVADVAHTISEARGINKKAVVVGKSGAGAGTLAWVWEEGVTQNLNALIAVDDPNRAFVQLTAANGVNDKGEIVAEGVDSRLGGTAVRGYLLTPVP